MAKKSASPTSEGTPSLTIPLSNVEARNQIMEGLSWLGFSGLALDAAMTGPWSYADLAAMWRDNREIPTEQALVEAYTQAHAAGEAAQARRDTRAQLAEQWRALPAWVRGPYRPLYDAIVGLLDEGDHEAALAVIHYAEPRPGYSTEQVAVWEQVKGSFAAALQAL